MNKIIGYCECLSIFISKNLQILQIWSFLLVLCFKLSFFAMFQQILRIFFIFLPLKYFKGFSQIIEQSWLPLSSPNSHQPIVRRIVKVTVLTRWQDKNKKQNISTPLSAVTFQTHRNYHAGFPFNEFLLSILIFFFVSAFFSPLATKKKYKTKHNSFVIKSELYEEYFEGGDFVVVCVIRLWKKL